MRKKMRSYLSLLLIIGMLLPICSHYGEAALVSEMEQADGETVGVQAEDLKSLETTSEYEAVNDDTLPQVIASEVAKERGHVKRLRGEEENLNSLLFGNEDGTKTMYLFDYPVKVRREDGTTEDITLHIKESVSKSGAYQSETHPANIEFPRLLTEGIILEQEEVELRLVPVTLEMRTEGALSFAPSISIPTAALGDNDVVSYRLDENTSFEYSLTYTGFKEDIVVEKYTGQTEYTFLLETNGLTLVQKDESLFLADDNGSIQANIGDVIIFTADEKNNTCGTMTYEVIKENEQYAMTIHVDADYLKDVKTKYPIRIDPTIEINYDSNGSDAIQDVTINSGMGSSGSSGTLFVGKRTSGGIARALMRFPNLDLSSIASVAQIQSATVEIRDVMCESTAMAMSCYVFTGNTWVDSTATWSTVNPNSYTQLLDTQTISYSNGKNQTTAHRYCFDITDAVIGWKVGNYSLSKGIVFKASSGVESSSSELYKSFASYNRASYKPSLSIVYTNVGSQFMDGNYYLNNEYTGKYLTCNSSTLSVKSGLLSSLASTIQWKLTNMGTYYVIQPVSNSSMYLAGIATDGNAFTIRTLSNETIPDVCKWYVQAVGSAEVTLRNVGTGRYLRNNGTSLSGVTSTGTYASDEYSRCTWRIVKTSVYGNSSSYAKRELKSTDQLFSSLTLDISQTDDIRQNGNQSALMWCDINDFEYSETGSVVTVSDTQVTGYGSGNATVTATHKVTGLKLEIPVKVYTTGIIIIPGIMGSELEAGSSNSIYSKGTDLWTNELIRAVENGEIAFETWLNRFKSLKLTSGGASLHSVDVVEGATDAYGMFDTYNMVMREMSTTLEGRCEVCFFAYDWRQSNAVTAQELNTFITERGFEKVILIGHSMGGLVASSYLSIGQAQQNKVHTFISVGTPYLGVPAMPYFWYTEDINLIIEGFEISDEAKGDLNKLLSVTNPFNSIFGTFRSLYEIVPNEYYFNSDYAGQNYLLDVQTYSSTKQVLLNELSGENYVATYVNDAETFHDTLYLMNGEHITAGVNAFYIAGMNEVTIQKYSMGDGINGMVRMPCGDGLVPTWSATLGDKYSNRTFYVNDDHTGMIMNENVIEFMIKIIDGNHSTSQVTGVYDEIQ